MSAAGDLFDAAVGVRLESLHLLVNNAGSYLTGTVIPLDGGITGGNSG
ncbi:MAG TPA: hypothetical protein VNR66_02655 [Solirubrobacteraceae bacterium]|nr:hypothetical protein [Solirubrobacteraceae bacterium]